MMNQWTPWIKLHKELFYPTPFYYSRGAHFFDSLDGKGMAIPQEYRLLVALALSVAHWHPDADPRGGDGTTCPLCMMFSSYCHDSNRSCPLVQVRQNCNRSGSIWMKWNLESKYADKMYKLLLKLYVAEYKRLGLEVITAYENPTESKEIG